jgi:hypothetical protein
MPAYAPQHRAEAVFGRQLVLEGYRLESTPSQPGGTLDLTLYWRTLDRPSRPYTVFTHLIDGGGRLVAQQDNWPIQGQWPPTCWRPGDRVADPYRIQLPEELPAGVYTLLAGLYDGRDGRRLLTAGGADAVELGRINISR